MRYGDVVCVTGSDKCCGKGALYNPAMVSVVHSVAAQSDLEQSLQTLCEGLNVDEGKSLRDAEAFAREIYGEHTLGSGEGVWSHALGMALILCGLKLDADSRLAALLFAVPTYDEHGLDKIEARFGRAVAHLVSGISRLNRLRPITRDFVADAAESPAEMKAQIDAIAATALEPHFQDRYPGYPAFGTEISRPSHRTFRGLDGAHVRPSRTHRKHSRSSSSSGCKQ